MSKFAYSMSDGEAILAFKKGFMGVGVGNVAILKDKGNAFVLGAPMMEVDVKFENGIVTTGSRGMGRTLLATVDTKIELIEGFRKVTDAEAKAIRSDGASSQSSEPAKEAAPQPSEAPRSAQTASAPRKESVTTSYGESNFTKGRSAGLIVVSAFTLFFVLFNASLNFPKGASGFYVAYVILYALCATAAVGFCIFDIVFAARKERNMPVFAIGMMVKVVALLCTGLENEVWSNASCSYSSAYADYICYENYWSFYAMEYCYRFFSVLFNSGLLLLYSLLFLTVKESPVVKTVRVEVPVAEPAPSIPAPVAQPAPAPAMEETKKEDEPNDVAETLKKYKALKDEGLIDEDMYKEKAKKLLGL